MCGHEVIRNLGVQTLDTSQEIHPYNTQMLTMLELCTAESAQNTFPIVLFRIPYNQSPGR